MKNSFAKTLRKAKQNKTVYLMLLPGFLFLAVFALYPIIWILRTMFCIPPSALSISAACRTSRRCSMMKCSSTH